MNSRNLLFGEVKKEKWEDWHWQMQNCISHKNDITKTFPQLPKEQIQLFSDYTKKYKMKITPYLLSLIELDDLGNPKPMDPIWRQFSYLEDEDTPSGYESDEAEENWENPEEMPTKVLQHKYPDRAIIRVTDVCFGHCNYCYLTSRVLDHKTSKEKTGSAEDWQASMDYLRNNPGIRDVLISGGDPLVFNNERIEQVLKDIRSIKSIETIRLNTRVFTFNPYRFDEGLVAIFKKHELTALEVHMCHYRELTETVDRQMALMDKGGYRPLILWRAPLLKGINSDEKDMEQLLMGLYRRRITPYYLFHYAPFTLGRAKLGVSLKEGSRMMHSLRRKIPGPAFPTFTLFHIEGKQDVPLDQGNTFRYEVIEGRTVAKFKNWKGNDVTYPDVE